MNRKGDSDMKLKHGVMAAMVVAMCGVWSGPVRADQAARNEDGSYVPVGSRIFDAVSYDAATQRLTLLFKSGGAYVYHDVPREVFRDFTRIVNKGEYFSKRVRGVYACERMTGETAAWCLKR